MTTQLELNKMVGIYRMNSIHTIDKQQIVIYNALNTSDNTCCSLKKVSVSEFVETSKFKTSTNKQPRLSNYQLLDNQINILKKLKGNRFLKCYQILKTKNSCYYVYDHHPSLSLRDLCLFIQNKQISQKTHQNIKNVLNKGSLLSQIQIYQFQKISIIMQLLSILENLHLLNIVHNDLSGANIFITEGENSVDDQGFRVVVGGFYESEQINRQEKNLNQNKIKDIRSLGKIIQDLNIFEDQNSENNLRKSRYSSFVYKMINATVETVNQLTIPLIRQKLQKFTTSGFSSVKFMQLLDQSFGQSSCSKPKILSQTTSQGNVSFGQQSEGFNQSSMIQQFFNSKQRKFSQSAGFFEQNKQEAPYTNPLIRSQFKQRTTLPVQFNTQRKQNNQNYLKLPDKKIYKNDQDLTIYLKTCQKSIKIAFKICIFATANRQTKLVSYFLQLTSNMVQNFKQKINQCATCDNNYTNDLFQKHAKYVQNLNQLKKINKLKIYAQDSIQNVYSSDKGVKYGSKNQQNNRQQQQIILNFIQKMLKAFQKYNDMKILANTCILADLYYSVDMLESLRMKRKNLEKIISIKSKIDLLSCQQLKQKLIGFLQKRQRYQSIQKSPRKLSRSKQFKIN